MPVNVKVSVHEEEGCNWTDWQPLKVCGYSTLPVCNDIMRKKKRQNKNKKKMWAKWCENKERRNVTTPATASPFIHSYWMFKLPTARLIRRRCNVQLKQQCAPSVAWSIGMGFSSGLSLGQITYMHIYTHWRLSASYLEIPRRNGDRNEVALFYIATPPTADLASELRWPVPTNMYTASFQRASIEVQHRNTAINWDPWSIYRINRASTIVANPSQTMVKLTDVLEVYLCWGVFLNKHLHLAPYELKDRQWIKVALTKYLKITIVQRKIISVLRLENVGHRYIRTQMPRLA